MKGHPGNGRAPDDDAADAITVLLRRVADGDSGAEEALLVHLYEQLRLIAARHLRHERADHTLQPTALVHEAYVRLIRGGTNQVWNDRVHFLAAASTVMRRILVDHARRRTAAKRGGRQHADELDDWMVAVNHPPERILAVDQALTILAQSNPRAARIVELKFFAGLTDQETANALGLSERTVKRDWQDAKMQLYTTLKS
jgi:RNA polymerase sigma factor (TIGR02999 family)